MMPWLRVLGVAVLAVALLDGSAGICFCHRGPGAPGEAPASHNCCHGPDGPGPTALKAAALCCHIESAEHQATPVTVVHLEAPAGIGAPMVFASASAVTRPADWVKPASSPPLFTLRI